MRDFPRFSLSGSFILVAYLYVTKIAFDRSVYSDSLHRTDGGISNSSSVALNGIVFATSLLNAISHAAVVLGALHDTYVLSILVGVGFDVFTQSLRLIWWLQLTLIAFQEHEIMRDDTAATWNILRECVPTGVFLMVLLKVYVYHMKIHVGALRISQHSHMRVMEILHASLNNLRGIPGEKYKDHVFAYTDLGGHLAPLILSINLLDRQGELKYGIWTLLYLVLASGMTLSIVPFNQYSENTPIINVTKQKIECRCRACTVKSKVMGNCCSFTCSIRDGVCHLWLYSFEELAIKLEKAGDYSNLRSDAE